MLYPNVFGLTRSESKIFGALMNNGTVTMDALSLALYGKRRDTKVVDVLICSMRRKLQPLGIEILTHWGRCRQLPRESREIAQKLLTDGIPRADCDSARAPNAPLAPKVDPNSPRNLPTI